MTILGGTLFSAENPLSALSLQTIKDDGRHRLFVDLEPEDVGAGIMSHHVEVEFRSVEIGDENALSDRDLEPSVPEGVVRMCWEIRLAGHSCEIVRLEPF